MIFEMLTGHTPFHDQSNNFKKIECNIKEGRIQFPEYVSEEAKDII